MFRRFASVLSSVLIGPASTDIPEGTGELFLRYSIEVEKGPTNTNSGSFLQKGGHVRNQYFWHPFFFDFNSSSERAHFQVEARIPEEYYLSMSIPQTERTEGGERVVIAKTVRPTFALTVVYDRDWKVMTEEIELQLFVSPEFRPSAHEIAKEFKDYYREANHDQSGHDTIPATAGDRCHHRQGKRTADDLASRQRDSA